MHGISSHTILDWVKVMASERYAGRLTGTPEYDACADWTAGLLKSWKYKPAGDNGHVPADVPESLHARETREPN